MTRANTLKYEGYTAKIEFDAEDRLFSGRLLGIKDVVHFTGTTVEELEEAMKASIRDYLDWLDELGQRPETPFSGKTQLRFPSGLHEETALAAASRDESLNEFIVEAVRQRIRSLVLEESPENAMAAR